MANKVLTAEAHTASVGSALIEQAPVRHLLLRGGPLDGTSWEGMVDVGKRIACGPGRWSMANVYLVTAEQIHSADGTLASIAVPAEPVGSP